jgi:hypothetical protein
MKTAAALTFALSLLAPIAFAQSPCSSWEITPVPADPSWYSTWLYDVSALSSDDAWAVGYNSEPGVLASWKELTYAVHWDGSQWTQVPTPSPEPYPNGASCYLNTVTMVSPNDVWAAGSRYGDAGGLSVGDWIFVIHYDGSSWTEVPVETPPGGVSINFSGTRVLESIAFGPNDVWFGGWWGEPNSMGSVTWRPLLMHWDGSQMTIHDGPAPHDGYYGYHVVSMSGTGPNDIWAACQKNVLNYSEKIVMLHYDGSNWSEAPIPDAPEEVRLNEVVSLAANDVFAFFTIPWTTDSYVLHYDGNGWSPVSNPPYADAATAHGGTIYFGTVPTARIERGTISMYEGGTTTLLEPLSSLIQPEIQAMDSFDPCGAWAVGVQFVSGEGMRPLAVRMDSTTGSWTTMGGGIAGTSGLTPRLTGSGTLLGGTPLQVTLADALPGASSTLVVSPTAANLPLRGGTLVPNLSILLSGLPVSPSGGWVLDATWPNGAPAGANLYLQAWLPDPAAVQGYAASDGLRATAP